MAKKGVKTISGPTAPRIGQPAIYTVTEWHSGTPDALKANVKWELFKKRNSGQYTTTSIIKNGPIATFTFGEVSANHDYKVEGYLFNPELSGPSTVNVTPLQGPPSITTITMLDYKGDRFITTPKYGQIVTVSIQTVNMVGESLTISLWERDTMSDTGHDPEENIKLWETRATIDNTNGNIKVKKLLSLDMAVNANKDIFEGDTHEYYVLVKAERVNLASYSTQQLDISADTSNYVINNAIQQALEVEGIASDPIPENGNSPNVVEDMVDTEDEDKCPRCENDITFDEINKICVNASGRNLITNDQKIKEALPYLNKYRDKIGLNTCTKKAHFLAQLAQESKFYDLAEGFNYYWEALISTFSAFQTTQGRVNARLWGRQVKSRSQPNYVSVPLNTQILIASWAYKSKNLNGGFESQDGWKYRGRGFKQITWKSNYKVLSEYFNTVLKLEGDADVDWVANPESLTENGKDAMLSALTYWAKNGINAVATGSDNDDVTNVTRKINPALKGIDERKRYFSNAVNVLKVNQCNPGNVTNEEGMVVLISGQGAKMMGTSVVYETKVYKNITLETFKQLENNDDLTDPAHTTFFARDAHGEKYGKHSNQRYGTYNECPPGEYYLIPSTPGQKYKLYVSEDGTTPYINGIHGQRSGIALHQYRPFYAIGCLTSCTGRDLSVVNTLLEALDDLPLNDNKPVRVIIEERNVTETQWPNAAVGTKKWTGIL